ncbi:hypothetical protein Back11_13340 [Paenibacillus baekrokdamisoli]|uniref:Uncharacterized protein n=1 Tax=Paenibacillus baekrokdamisoli TaxID=1712516 RepID=A0A3G9JAG3_9BACL|nr:HEAT repeat domain-containing protein [Paenibacillus baekrokdamisoli]MBB3070638.1 HEAT repeat protein [Paenibacillus baekrokdamisoli]BBH19989.1 hypothetical protein Back11_13340 [Paenibacillus baekrokdamisoli]
MSIAILFDLQLEVRRLFIAGSRMAEGDLRLKKILPQLQKLGESAAVFKRVAQAFIDVVEPTDKSEGAAAKLLDLSTLLNSILYTQGTTEVQGDSEEVVGTTIALSTKIPYRKLSPVIEALTSKGQGRMERINQAYEEHLLKDFRVLPAVVAALDDSYAEIADFVSQKVIPEYGEDALPVLLKQYDLNGGRAHGRRLTLVHELLRESGMELYLQAAREGSVEVRMSAIELLGNYPAQESLILEQADDKKKEIRNAAYVGLAKLGTDKAVDRLYRALTTGRDRDNAVAAIQQCEAASLTHKVIDNAEVALEQIVSATEKEEPIKQLLADLECLDEKQQPEVLDFLKKLLSTPGVMIPAAENIQEKAAQLLLWMKLPEAYEFAVGLQEVFNGRFIGYSFQAAYTTLTADEVYERFSKELREPKKKMVKDLLIAAIHQVAPSSYQQLALVRDPVSSDEEYIHKLDPRWVHLFAEIDQEELVWSLAEKPDKKITAYLVRKFQVKPKFRTHRSNAILLVLFRSGYKEAPELLMTMLEKDTANNIYYLDELQRTLLYLLPRSYADRLRVFADGFNYLSVKQQTLEIAEQLAEKPEELVTEKGTGLWGWIKNKMS